MSADALLAQARAIKDELVTVRRDIHRHPELAFEEQRTAAKGRDWLQGLGLEVQDGIAGTYGLVATLNTGRPGLTLLLRADMDALPIAEETGTEYISETPDVMHACGHDAQLDEDTLPLGTAAMARVTMDYVQREGHASVDVGLTGGIMGAALFRVASDDDDAPDQGCWWGKLQLSQLDAPANALDQPQSVRGSYKALAAQHAEIPQTFDERVGLNAILYSKLIRQEGFMPMWRWLGASGAALGTQTTQVGWKEDRRVYLGMDRVHHWRIWSHPVEYRFKRFE